ncbi:mitochondrial pyruvate dehydrogenase (PDH) kinase [Andalucia godoyi]|uniref:Protein-serine/threonine kinase n=1 Tax=Andalucia godoyi TaxID=505711 RepID=A0A8K0AHC7_ANDGO|nr:mitochondrial pyruvate dehydrogenase (PDH) kinase [Andalucia godoyi]|eukprot:ANDGO_06796.mRNA.1 mitochondrial pyruvate dehydrogenase (PDH) kinase
MLRTVSNALRFSTASSFAAQSIPVPIHHHPHHLTHTHIHTHTHSHHPASTSLHHHTQLQLQQQQQQQQQQVLSSQHIFRNAVLSAASKSVTPISLRTLFEFGKNTSPKTLVLASQFLHNELPIRLSHRIVELENLPFGLSEMPSVKTVHGLYVDSFRLIHEFPKIRSIEDDLKFTDVLDGIKTRHNWVVQQMAQGIRELKKKIGADILGPELQQFLDRFYLSRISIRMLIGQHLALHALTPEERRQAMQTSGFVGIITKDCRPTHVAEDASRHAKQLCDTNYGVAPKVKILGSLDTKFTYVPSHLYLMLFELIKNSMRATVETQRSQRLGVPQEEMSQHLQQMLLRGEKLPEWLYDDHEYPEINVIVANGQEDVTIKVSDKGGGIPRSALPVLWTYSYTTAKNNDAVTSSVNGPSGSGSSLFDPSPSRGQGNTDRIAGYGYGLPLSKLYARYFGGDLELKSLESWGTDAYLYIRRLADHEEDLP